MKQKLIGVIICNHDGDVGFKLFQLSAVFRRQLPYPLHGILVFCLGKGKELGGRVPCRPLQPRLYRLDSCQDRPVLTERVPALSLAPHLPSLGRPRMPRRGTHPTVFKKRSGDLTDFRYGVDKLSIPGPHGRRDCAGPEKCFHLR